MLKLYEYDLGSVQAQHVPLLTSGPLHGQCFLSSSKLLRC